MVAIALLLLTLLIFLAHGGLSLLQITMLFGECMKIEEEGFK
jgi:hypothetical protein